MSDARPVPSGLRRVLVIQDPHRRTRAHHKACGRLQEKVTASSLLNAGASTVKKDYRREAVDVRHSIEHDMSPAS